MDSLVAFEQQLFDRNFNSYKNAENSDLGSHARHLAQRASLTQHLSDLGSNVCRHLRLSAREGTLLTLDSHGPLFGAILGHRSATRKGTLRSYDLSARKGLATLLRDLVTIPRLYPPEGCFSDVLLDECCTT